MEDSRERVNITVQSAGNSCGRRRVYSAESVTANEA